MTTQEVPETPQGQAPAEAPSGSSEHPGIVATTIARPAKQPESGKQPETPAQVPPVTTPHTQPSEKDYRHAVDRMHEEITAKLRIAEKLIDKDPDAIYDIAAEDPALAKSLLKRRPDYGVATIEELMERRDQTPDNGDDELRTSVASTASQVKKLEEQLRDERILRMKERHPDLKDELEDEFRKMYSDKRFDGYQPDQILNIARALLGKTPPAHTPPVDVTVALHRQNEGAQPAVRPSGSAPGEDPRRAHSRAQWGFTKEDEAKYLPPNIDDILGAA